MENKLVLQTKTNKTDTGKNSVLRKLYLNELKTIYWVEKQMLKLFPGWIRSATTPYLKAGFKGHFSATEQHIKRIKEVFGLLEEKRNTKRCEIVERIILNSKMSIKLTKQKTLDRDLKLLNTAQKFERYETNAYRKLVRFANIFGELQIELILKETLTEEIEAEEVFIAIEEDTLKDEFFKTEKDDSFEEEDEFEAVEEE